MINFVDNLRYVKNTGGNATLENFYEDWEPVGEMIWGALTDAHLVEINADGKIALTKQGEGWLAAKTEVKS